MIKVILRDVWDHRRGRPKEEPTVGEEEEPAVSDVTEDSGSTTAVEASNPR
jgi:hypothetical protein